MEHDEPRSPAIEDRVLQQAVDHMYSNTKVEMGGFFVGELADGRARIDAAIPALKAPSSLVNLTFDHDTWTDIVTQVDRDHAGKVIVGWFHSHPGHGVFLSGYDEFIQTSFFSSDGMVALVVDPHDGSTGWFTTTGGAIAQPIRGSIPAAPTARSSQGRPVPSTPPMTVDRPSRSTIVVASAVAAIIGALSGFLIARAVVSDDTPSAQAKLTIDELREQQAADRETIEQLRERGTSVPTTTGPPSTTTTSTPRDSYRILPDDTLFGIAERLYGDGDLWDRLYNFGSNDSVIGELGPEGRLPGSAVGRTITVPTREELG